MSALSSLRGPSGFADEASSVAAALLGPPAWPSSPPGEASAPVQAGTGTGSSEAATEGPALGGSAAQWVLQARAMPEFAAATDADLMKVASDIRAASGFGSPQEIAAWYRANPLLGSAPRQAPKADGTTAPLTVGQLPGVSDTRHGVVRFGLSLPAIRRDVVIWRAFEGVRRGVLQPARALQDSLRACAVFGAEVAQRVHCYARIDPSDLRALRDLRPILRDPHEAETREFAYVQRVVLKGETLQSILTERSVTLNERVTVPLRAMEVLAAGSKPRPAAEQEREAVLATLAAGRQSAEAAERAKARR